MIIKKFLLNIVTLIAMNFDVLMAGKRSYNSLYDKSFCENLNEA